MNERDLDFLKADAVQKLCGADGHVLVASSEEMGTAGAIKVFHPVEYTKRWLEVPASEELFKQVYGQRSEKAKEFLLTGQWAPRYLPLRAIPDFLSEAGGPEDLPECNRIMGQGNQFTGGTFSGACTCAHPKTIGVVVLDGSEGQRMPIEFEAQRMRTMPDGMLYDFSCAALKTALARLPLFALFLACLVHRFHRFKNHVCCSKAMNPDLYTWADGRNSSASEERKAASRRLQNFLLLVNQRNFFLFTVYRQAVGNDTAVHRDVRTPKMVDRWILWYRKKFVDVNIPEPRGGQQQGNHGGGVGPKAEPTENVKMAGEHVGGVVEESVDEKDSQQCGESDAEGGAAVEV